MIYHNGDMYPDVFLAGAPKSGTTFLFSCLAKHSQICTSNPKETDYYLDADNPNRKSDRNRAKKLYSGYYEDLGDDFLHLDGSVWTIYQTDLIEKIGTLERKPRVLFILREPARRILSSYQYTSNNLSAVRGLSFSQYVDCLVNSDWARVAEACKSKTTAYSLKNELLFSQYSFYLDKWRDAIGSENMKILLFEDLKTNPDACYSEVCEFLGLETEQLNFDFGEKNQSVVIKNGFIHYLLHRAFSLVGYKVPFKEQLKKAYSRLQHAPEPVKVSHSKDLERLKEYYEPFNRKLASDYKLNLVSWE